MYQDKTTKLIVQLNKKTIKNEIKWDSVTAPLNFNKGSEDIIPLIYTCRYKEKILALYIRKYKYFVEEHEFYWSEKLCLAILNEDYQIVWETNEQGQPIRDLYLAVTEQAAGVDDLLDDLLNDN